MAVYHDIQWDTILPETVTAAKVNAHGLNDGIRADGGDLISGDFHGHGIFQIYEISSTGTEMPNGSIVGSETVGFDTGFQEPPFVMVYVEFRDHWGESPLRSQPTGDAAYGASEPNFLIGPPYEIGMIYVFQIAEDGCVISYTLGNVSNPIDLTLIAIGV